MYITLRDALRRVCIGPANRLGDLVVMPDALHDLALQTLMASALVRVGVRY